MSQSKGQSVAVRISPKTQEVINALAEKTEYTPSRVAYIMIDAGGRLVDNTTEAYTVVADILQEDFSTGFNIMRFDAVLYDFRYGK